MDEVVDTPILNTVKQTSTNFGNLARRVLTAMVVQTKEVISLINDLRIRAKENIYFQVSDFTSCEGPAILKMNYHCEKLKLSTEEPLEVKSCQEIKLKAGDAIEFEPSGNCEIIGLCSDECGLKMWATDNLKIKACGDIKLRPECGNVIRLENNTEVPCGHDLSFLESGSAINFVDSSYITTAGSRIISSGGDHTIQLSDNGQTLWMYTGYTVYVPLNSDIALPIGTRISIASDGNTVYITRSNASVTIVAHDYGTYGGSYWSWALPAYMKAEIIKVDTNYWVLSAPRIFRNV